MSAVTYSKVNLKQRFIYDKLLSEMLYNVSNSGMLSSRLARMKIFPFADADGSIKISSITEGNIPWFYLSEGNSRSTSRGSYRILADDVLTPELKSRLISALGETYIRQYDEKIILEDIVKQMQPERDYSALWWTKAKEIFELWNGSSADNEFFEPVKKSL